MSMTSSTRSPSVAAVAREATLSGLAAPFDVVVIGGGVNGCGIAWDAALRGLRVLLVEKEDFGWATSAWNSRLIHGGLKYLEKYDIPLVRESLREREWMLHAAPHLVRPQRFVLPFYTRNTHSRTLLRAGMLAYDVLSFDKTLPWHRTHGPSATLDLVPGLNPDGLQGAATYFDAQADYAERLSVEVALAAGRAGAVVLNHASVTGLHTRDGRVSGVELLDSLSGRSHTVLADAVVNAAGPWVDEVLATGGRGPRPRLMGGTKGTHLVVDPFPGAPVGSVMYYEALTDSRPMMIIPWLGRYIIGATDVRFSGDLDRATVDLDELTYILRETNLVIPGAGLTATDVLWSYTGVRPLPYSDSGPTGDITRRHTVHDHSKDPERPAAGLYSVIGGKLTTFRSLAEDVVDSLLGKQLVRGRLGRNRRTATTRRLRLPGAQVRDLDHFRQVFLDRTTLPAPVAQRLLTLYGARAVEVEALATLQPGLLKPVGDVPGLIAAEIVLAVRAEGARSLSDVVARRVMTGLDGDLGRSTLQPVAEVMARELLWSESALGAELDSYHRYIEKLQPAV